MTRPPEDLDFAAFLATGDPAAMARLFDRAAPKLLLLASHWTKDPAEAEDLVQLTFLHAVRDAASWDGRQPALPWLAAILAHRALDRRRGEARRASRPIDPEQVAAREPTPLQAAMDGELTERVSTAIDGLADPYRDVLVLRVVHGLMPTEIAHALGRAPATVRKQLERGLHQLRAVLPASIAGLLLASLMPSRGLAALRAEVLAAAGPGLPAGTITLGGMLLVNKLVVSTLVLAVAIATVLLWPRSAGGPPVPGSVEQGAQPASITADAVPEPAAAAGPIDRIAVAARAGDDAEPGAGVEVLVLAEGDDTPVPGVGVELLLQNGHDVRLATVRATTDARGLASFERLASGPYRITLDRGPAAKLDVRDGERQRTTLRVPVTGAVTGIVVDASGRPVPGAGIWSYPTADLVTRSPSSRAATSDAEGRFRVPSANGELGLQARHDDYAPSQLLVVKSAGMRAITLELGGRPARLIGSVTRAGEPVHGARLELQRAQPPQRRTPAGVEHVHADRFAQGDDGTFLFEGLLPGRATLTVRASGAAQRSIEVDLTAGNDTEIAVVLDAAAVLRGRVCDPDGAAIGDAEIIGRSGGASAWTTTTSGGEFYFDFLSAGTFTVQVARVEGYCGRKLDVALLTGQEVTCEFVLEPLPLLRGRIVDVAGRGLRGLVVTAVRVDLGRNRWMPMTDDRGRLDTGGRRQAVAGDEGRFDLGVMPGVEYALDVQEPGQWLHVEGERFGHFTAPRDGIVLTIEPEELATASVRGRVLDPEGEPLAGAWFQLTDGKRIATIGTNTPGTPRSDAEGRFHIGPVPARGYVLKVHAADAAVPTFDSARFELRPNDTLDLGDVQAPGGAVLSVRLLRTDGVPFYEARLQLEAEGRPPRYLRFDADGKLEQSVLPGRYTMSVYGGEFPQWRQEIELEAGARKHLELSRPPGVAFRLDATLPDGEASGQITVRAEDGTVEFEYEFEREATAGRLTHFGPIFVPRFSLGPHRAELTCASGKHYLASFVVTDQPAGPGERTTPEKLVWSPAR